MSDITPELDNWKEIEQLMSSELQAQRSRGIAKTLQSVVLGIVNTRRSITGLRSTIHSAADKLEKLNSTIEAANQSSEKLTTALNRITLAGAIIAGIGVLTAIASLIFEIYKYSH
jgi:hypothetical protein